MGDTKNHHGVRDPASAYLAEDFSCPECGQFTVERRKEHLRCHSCHATATLVRSSRLCVQCGKKEVVFRVSSTANHSEKIEGRCGACGALVYHTLEEIRTMASG